MNVEKPMNETPVLLDVPSTPKAWSAKQYRVVCLRECPLPSSMSLCTTPEEAARYWKNFVETDERFSREVETFVVLMVNTRRKIIGHTVISTGTLDTILVHAREVFRAAIVANAAAVVLMHYHPSGDPTPSEADIRVTHELIKAGQLLKIEVLDHVIIGIADPGLGKGWCSLREIGYFHS